jgi:putative membrane protein
MMWGADGWWWGWIMMISVWVVIVLLFVWAIKGDRRGDRSGHGDAQDRLDERFANGEIDAEDYEARRKLIRQRR